MWLTREKTKLEKSPQTGRKEQMERPAYLQLDLLTRGAVFVSTMEEVYFPIQKLLAYSNPVHRHDRCGC